jgi:hypothetical protein
MSSYIISYTFFSGFPRVRVISGIGPYAPPGYTPGIFSGKRFKPGNKLFPAQNQ